MNLDEIEKGNTSIPFDPGKAIAETLRLTAANNAMLNTLLNLIIERSDLFSDKEEAIKFVEEENSRRFNELWADVLHQIYKR